MRHRQRKKTPHPIVPALAEIRKERGISQMKMADMLGCTRSKIEHLETGWAHNPTITFLAEYAAVLGVEITINISDNT